MAHDCRFCGGWHFSPKTVYFCMALCFLGGHYTPTEEEIKKLDEYFPLSKKSDGV